MENPRKYLGNRLGYLAFWRINLTYGGEKGLIIVSPVGKIFICTEKFKELEKFKWH